MSKQNCWEFKNCGREPGGRKTKEEGVCPAATFELADGFNEGKNGGRACTYIVGTLCSEDIRNTIDVRDKERFCCECPFYKQLKSEYGVKMSLIEFHDFINKKRKAQAE